MTNTLAAQQIISSIRNATLTDQELRDIALALKNARAKLSNTTIDTLRVGDTVEWNGKRGAQKGKITKIAIKYVTVQTQYNLWRVPASMLKKAA